MVTDLTSPMFQEVSAITDYKTMLLKQCSSYKYVSFGSGLIGPPIQNYSEDKVYAAGIRRNTIWRLIRLSAWGASACELLKDTEDNYKPS